jgi:hypothetical protein
MIRDNRNLQVRGWKIGCFVIEFIRSIQERLGLLNVVERGTVFGPDFELSFLSRISTDCCSIE